MKYIYLSKKNQKGNALIIVTLLFVMISLSMTIGLVAPAINTIRIVKDSVESKQSYAAAESGVEDVYYRLQKNLTVSASQNLSVGGAQAVVTVTDSSPTTKTISVSGNSENRIRTLSVAAQRGVGSSFSYGLQSGLGGISMTNGSQVNGSVYSNGPITGSGAITGTAISANSPALTTDQQNDSGTPTNNINFGNTNGTQDVAQSFQVSTTGPLNKIQVYIRKVSTPGNLTVRIVTNNNGNPSTSVIATGTLSASLVSTSYGWVEVALSSNPQLSAGTTYWLVLDGATNSSRYYTIGATSATYPNGVGKIGQYSGTWNNTTPSGLDYYFRIFLGGLNGSITGITVGSGGVGDAWANTVNNSTISGTNYCKSGSGNNKSCNTSRPDPTPVPMPISEQVIQDWKDVAQEGGTHTGNRTISSNTTLGPIRITGDLLVDNGVTLTVGGTIWVQGNFTVSNNAIVRLASWYGASSGVIVVDGTVTLLNNVSFQGSGIAGSYIMALSTSSSSSAITVNNNAGAVMLYAANGTVTVANNAGATQINGYRINLSNNAIINYDIGLVDLNFVNGPSGSWNASSWAEQ